MTLKTTVCARNLIEIEKKEKSVTKTERQFCFIICFFIFKGTWAMHLSDRFSEI